MTCPILIALACQYAVKLQSRAQPTVHSGMQLYCEEHTTLDESLNITALLLYVRTIVASRSTNFLRLWTHGFFSQYRTSGNGWVVVW